MAASHAMSCASRLQKIRALAHRMAKSTGPAQPVLGDRHRLHPNATRAGSIWLSWSICSRARWGGPMGSRVDSSLVLDALLTALWWRASKQAITARSDQGC